MHTHKKVRVLLVCLIVSLVTCLSFSACLGGNGGGSTCSHQWTNATCTTPKTCSLCNATEGTALGHKGGTATCSAKAVCTTCGEEYGELNANVHSGDEVWVKHVNTHSKAYDCCGAQIVDEENHSKVNGVCSVCGYDPVIKMSSTTTPAGIPKVVLTVSVEDNPGIVGLELSLTYDDTQISLISAESGSAMNKLAFTAPASFSSGCKFLWDGLDIADDEIENGEVLTLTFSVPETVAPGDYNIIMKVKAYDADLTQFTLKLVNGVITVE